MPEKGPKDQVARGESHRHQAPLTPQPFQKATEARPSADGHRAGARKEGSAPWSLSRWGAQAPSGRWPALP